jgi:hypothetical protein
MLLPKEYGTRLRSSGGKWRQAPTAMAGETADYPVPLSRLSWDAAA